MGEFGRSERGWISIVSLIVLSSCLVVMGLAVDIGNLIRAKTQLQVVADSAAHAALYTRELNSAPEAKRAAVAIANAQMDVLDFGEVLELEDIKFGSWNLEDQTFSSDPNGNTAVYVTTERLSRDLNAVQTFLLQIIGRTEQDVIAESVFITYRPTCLREGFVAEGLVDMQSNNEYTNGFCVHSNSHVEINTDNTFEPGSIVSMPNRFDLVQPASGFDNNTGVRDALRDGYYDLKILDRMDDIATGIMNFDPLYIPDYITSSVMISRSDRVMQTEDFTPGSVHYMDCPGGRTVLIHDPGPRRSFNSDTEVPWKTLFDVVIITDCDIMFGQGLKLENVLVISTSTDANAITTPGHLSIGRNDGCRADGGAQILSWGGIDAGADLRMYGGQMIAKGNIRFESNANGVEGASLIAGGTIDGTSNASFGFCGTGMENNFEVEYFRLAY